MIRVHDLISSTMAFAVALVGVCIESIVFGPQRSNAAEIAELLPAIRRRG